LQQRLKARVGADVIKKRIAHQPGPEFPGRERRFQVIQRPFVVAQATVNKGDQCDNAG
jgi:hypothetical protein